MTADENAETIRLREQLQHEMAMSRASARAYAENEAAYRSHAGEQSAQIARLRTENATLREAIATTTATAATQTTTIDGLERDLAASRLRVEQQFQELGKLRSLFRVNMHRVAPHVRDEEIDAVIEGAKGGG